MIHRRVYELWENISQFHQHATLQKLYILQTLNNHFLSSIYVDKRSELGQGPSYSDVHSYPTQTSAAEQDLHSFSFVRSNHDVHIFNLLTSMMHMGLTFHRACIHVVMFEAHISF